MSDWLTQLREAVERADSWIKDASMAIRAASVIGEREGTHLNYGNHNRLLRDMPDLKDAARLLASGRRPDKEEGVRYVREVLEIPASWLTTGDIHQLIDAALGGSDVLIVDIGEERE